MSKEEFCEIINRLHEATEIQESVHNIFMHSSDNIKNNFMNAAALQINHEDIVVKLLEEIMNDEYNFIQYFIYELDYGKRWTKESIVKADGTTIDISTPEKLYDYLTR